MPHHRHKAFGALGGAYPLPSVEHRSAMESDNLIVLAEVTLMKTRGFSRYEYRVRQRVKKMTL